MGIYTSARYWLGFFIRQGARSMLPVIYTYFDITRYVKLDNIFHVFCHKCGF